MKITVLGCGSSLGVPIIGCDCAVCNSTNPRNKRSRVSVSVAVSGKNFILDTSPDFRAQMLRENIKKIDAVLYTHDHADHTQGLDDLRPFNFMQDAQVQIYGNAELIKSLQQRFHYAFLPRPTADVTFRPSIVPNIIEEGEIVDFEVCGVKITAFQQQHGKAITLGYRIGNFAYSTDVDKLSEVAFSELSGVECWIVDCLRYTPSYSHSYLEQTLNWIERVKPKKAILTHMGHEFDYDKLSSELPSGVFAGYDGMVIDCI